MNECVEVNATTDTVQVILQAKDTTYYESVSGQSQQVYFWMFPITNSRTVNTYTNPHTHTYTHPHPHPPTRTHARMPCLKKLDTDEYMFLSQSVVLYCEFVEHPPGSTPVRQQRRCWRSFALFLTCRFQTFLLLIQFFWDTVYNRPFYLLLHTYGSNGNNSRYINWWWAWRSAGRGSHLRPGSALVEAKTVS